MEEIFNLILDGTEKEVFIPVSNEKQQDSVRSSLFHFRKKMPKNLRVQVGISKHKSEDCLYVKVFKRNPLVVLVKNSEGALVEKVITEEEKVERERQIRLMKADGLSEEEINSILNSQ